MFKKSIEQRYPLIDKWASHAIPLRWRQIGIDENQVQQALGYRDVHAQFGNILGWLTDLGETDLRQRIERAIKQYNTQQMQNREDAELNQF